MEIPMRDETEKPEQDEDLDEGKGDLYELLAECRYKQLLRFVATDEGKTQLRRATGEVVHALQNLSKVGIVETRAEERRLAPLEILLSSDYWWRGLPEPPADVILAVLKADRLAPKLLSDNLGGITTMLHKYCELQPLQDEEASVRVVQALLAAHPDAPQMIDANGNLPLHWAAQNNAPVKIMQEMLAAYPKAASIPDRLGMLPLHLHCMSRDWTEDATTNSSLAEKGATSNKQMTTSFQALLRAFPDAIYVFDRHGLLPIHYCARGNEKVNAIREMLRIDPSIASIPEQSSGCLPLCSVTPKSTQQQRISVMRRALGTSIRHPHETTTVQLQEKWKLLVDAHPGGLFRRCPSCRLSPLSKHASPPLPRLLLMRASLSQKHLSIPHCKNGSLILHVACREREGDFLLDSVQYLVETYPAALATRDAMGQLPLHVAVATTVAPSERCYTNEMPSSLMEFLVDSYGQALWEPTRDGYLPVMLAFQNPRVCLSVLYLLLRQHPMAIVAPPC